MGRKAFSLSGSHVLESEDFQRVLIEPAMKYKIFYNKGKKFCLSHVMQINGEL
jgi:hypothetical protein